MSVKMPKKKQSRKAARSQKAASRPLGLTIICILSWIGSAVQIGAGIMLLFMGTGLGKFSGAIAVLGQFSYLIAAVAVLSGIVTIMITRWLWRMEKRGYTWTMVFGVVSMILSVVSFNFIGSLMVLVILVYLWIKREIFK